MKKLYLGAALLLLALAAGLWLTRGPRPPASPRAPRTIESSGEIFGLAIDSPMAGAREKLDALRVSTVYTPDQKEKTGRRIYWKLRGTEFDWIMAWANPEGKITRLRAVYRPENAKPFGEIGDLRTAASVSATAVKWNLRRPSGTAYRLIAQGTDQRARTVYMFSLALPEDAKPEAEEGEDD